MGKYLTGGAGTGKKINKNLSLWSYDCVSSEYGNGHVTYHFDWNFDGQTGYITIVVYNGVITDDSLMMTRESSHPFQKTLGIYNDSSLRPVFIDMLNSINVVAE